MSNFFFTLQLVSNNEKMEQEIKGLQSSDSSASSRPLTSEIALLKAENESLKNDLKAAEKKALLLEEDKCTLQQEVARYVLIPFM